MSRTSDTEFYSLSLNLISPPPLPTYEDAIKQNANHSAQGFSLLPRAFFPQLTRPFPSSNFSDAINNITAEPRPRNWFTKLSDLVISWWLWELSSWLLSALCVFSIACILGYYDGHVIPDSWPLGITLNAYISVLSGIVKFTLAVPTDQALGQLKWQYFAEGPAKPLIDFERFDDASRGPWGALALFVSTRGRSVHCCLLCLHNDQMLITKQIYCLLSSFNHALFSRARSFFPTVSYLSKTARTVRSEHSAKNDQLHLPTPRL